MDFFCTVPPGNYHGSQGNGGNSNAESAMRGRLRAASEGQRLGFISAEEKQMLRKILLAKDGKLRAEDFDRAMERGDWELIRSRLRGHVAQNGFDDEASGMIHHMSEVRLESSPGVGGAEEFPNLFDPFYEQTELKDGMGSIVAGEQGEQEEYETPEGSFLIDDGDELVENMTPSVRKRQASRDKMRDFANNVFTDTFPREKLSKRIKPELNGSAGPSSSVNTNMGNGRGGSGPVALNGSNNVNKSRLSGLNPRQEGSFLKHLKKFNPASAAMDLITSKESLSKTKKNERERKRRLAVSKGFEDLATMLKPFDEEYGRPQSSKIDKATILRNTIETLRELKARVNALEKQNKELWDQIYARR